MVNYVKESGDDDGPSNLTRSEVSQLRRHILEKLDQGATLYTFTAEEAAAIKEWAATLEKFGPLVNAIIAREEAGELWAKVRHRLAGSAENMWRFVKWGLGAFLLIIAAVSAWKESISPLLNWLSGGK